MRTPILGVPLLLLAFGCDSAKRDINEAAPIQSVAAAKAEQELLAPRPAPAKSEPAAVELVAQAIKAHTDGKPERLARLKTVAFSRTGMGRGLGADSVPQTWTFDAAWPDRYRVRAEFPGPNLVTVAWSPAGGGKTVSLANAEPAKFPMKAEELKDYQLDATGEWLWLLFPLVEPEAVLASAPEATLDKQACPGVRLWHPQFTPAVVHFDPKTRLWKRITFEGREEGRTVVKEFTAIEMKPYEGVQLPHRLAQNMGGSQYADWTLKTFEARAALDPKLFELP